jgi:ATP-dependent protease Clp ATPase subunit
MDRKLLKGLTKEQIAKIRECKTTEEMLQIAKEEGIELSEEQLCQILTEPKNALIRQYTEIFKYDDTDLVFEKDALISIASRAIKNGTGARGLRAILEDLLLDTMYDIPDHKQKSTLTITKDYVENKITRKEAKYNDRSKSSVSTVLRRRQKSGESGAGCPNAAKG